MKWIPNYKQAIAYNAVLKHLFRFVHLLGGIRSGKTEVAFQIARAIAIGQPGSRILITRDTGPVLYTTTLNHFLSIIEPELIVDYKVKPNPTIFLANGTIIFFVAYDEIDITKAGGTDYCLIIMDEAQRFTFDQWAYFKGRLSQTKGEAYAEDGQKYINKITRRHLITTANPAGRGYLWRVYRRDHPGAYLGTDKKYFAVQLITKDNEKNLPPDFMADMDDLPEKLRKRLLEADEDPMEGVVFSNFDRKLHVISSVKNFIPAPHWPVYNGMDYGFKTPTVFIWATITEEGCIIVFREYRQRLKTIPENATGILTMNHLLKVTGMPEPKAGWGDPSMNFQDGKGKGGSTIYEQFVEHGLSWVGMAPRLPILDRVGKMASLLLPSRQIQKHPITGEFREEGWPRLMFTEECEQTIQEIEEWEWGKIKSDNKDHNEKPEEKDDHGIDACTYILCCVGNEKAPVDDITRELRESDPVYLRKLQKDAYLKEFTRRKKEKEKGGSIAPGTGRVF